MKIIQVSESLGFGDAVSNDVIAIDQLLKNKGMSGGIFVTNENNIYHKYINKIAKPISKVPDLGEDDILIFHHAIANDYCYELTNLKCRKILIYHNITPPKFFEGFNLGLQRATQKGLEQLKEMNNQFECCIAISEFNKQDLRKAGYTCPIYVCPILIPFDDYKKNPNKTIVEKYSDDCENILFVGRLSPQKKQEDIIHIFYLYKKYYNKRARLFLVGSGAKDTYGIKLQKYVEKINAKDVFITGSVPFEDILAYYSIADIFICMSEHEGFCVPLVEAMFFNVPILAYKSCAVPYTLGDSGIMLENKNFLLAAGWVDKILSDSSLMDDILNKQKHQLKTFSYDSVKNTFENILDLIINRKYLDKNISKKDISKYFDLIMPIKSSDWEVARKNLQLVKKNLNPKRILIISSDDLEHKLREEKQDTCIEFINENNLIDGMNLNSVKQTIKKAGGNPDVAGWFLQQFLKYGYSMVCKDNYFLVWDADTLPVNPISFFDNKTGKPYFNLKREYVKPYFKTIKNLLGIKQTRVESFITEHMMFDVNLCKKLIKDIESNSLVNGTTFWEKCIFACDFKTSQRAFSEYETFGNYVETYYPSCYKTRKLRTLRCGTEFLGFNPSYDILKWASKDFDTISFEHWSIPIKKSIVLCNDYTIRNNFSFGDIIRYICDDIKIKACMGNDEDKEIYNKLLSKLDFDYCFGTKTVYELLSN